MKKIITLLVLVILTVFLEKNMINQSEIHNFRDMKISDEMYREQFFSENMRQTKRILSSDCSSTLGNVEKEVTYYPVAESDVDKNINTSFENSWMNERLYGGKRGHEGTDIMPSKNKRGLYPVVSMTDGVVTNAGWIEKGGYRVGISADSGIYYYYAHLESFSNIKKGDRIKAGDLLGYMGDSGYGPEGTTGKFDVHLHVGIYAYEDGAEISLNPYYVLKYLENKKLKYAYF